MKISWLHSLWAANDSLTILCKKKFLRTLKKCLNVKKKVEQTKKNNRASTKLISIIFLLQELLKLSKRETACASLRYRIQKCVTYIYILYLCIFFINFFLIYLKNRCINFFLHKLSYWILLIQSTSTLYSMRSYLIQRKSVKEGRG